MKAQTGLFVGQGGYDIIVKEHIRLNGAVIASTAGKEKNQLDTGTLGWTDIDNRADFKASHTGVSLSTGGPVDKDLLTNLGGDMLSGANNSGHAQGITQAGLSEGSSSIRNTDSRQQDVMQLNRDTEHANDGSINPIFNKDKEQNWLRQYAGANKRSAVVGGDGYSGKVGYSSSNHASMLDRNQQSTLRSQISSQQGNVSLQAKNDISVNGADISAGKSLVLSGENVRLDVSEDRLHTRNDVSIPLKRPIHF